MSAPAAVRADPPATHPQVAAAFAALDGAGVRWVLLRGRDRLDPPSGDVDLLVEDLGVAARALGAAGWVCRRRWGHQAFWFAYHPATGVWVRLHLVDRVVFGRWGEYLLPVAPAVLAARRSDRGVAVPAPGDAFWLLALHCALDKATVAPHHQATLRSLAAQAHTGAVVDALRTAGIDVDAARRAAATDRWEELLGVLGGLGRRWDHSLRVRWRRIRNRAALGWRRAGEFLRPRRGRAATVALLAPDGAGKSSVAAALDAALPFDVRTFYLGLEAGRFAGRRRRLPLVGTLSRLGYAWRTYLTARIALGKGAVVVFDRHPVEALRPMPGRGRVRWRRALLGRALPRPELLVVLDAPGAVLHRRDPARDPDTAERDRQRYLALGRRFGGRVVDASGPLDHTLRQVVEALWDLYRQRRG